MSKDIKALVLAITIIITGAIMGIGFGEYQRWGWKDRPLDEDSKSEYVDYNAHKRAIQADMKEDQRK